jgi:diguanylate cyclase (GGDEF)-like protein
MNASSVTRPILAFLDFRRWQWWHVPVVLRAYVGFVILAACGSIGYALTETVWHGADLLKFALLVGCGMITVAATSRVSYGAGVNRDFLSAWVLPVAITLPPVYAMLAPIPLQILTQTRVHKGTVYRRVFTVAAMGQCYGAASLVFHSFPASFAGGSVRTVAHALTWLLAVVICEIIGGRGHHVLILVGIKLTDRTVRIADLELNREALQGDFAESDLGVLITVVVSFNAALAVVAVPMVLLIRRFVMHAQLLAKSRIDNKTGLLNSSTWEAEATIEVERALRTQAPLAVALIDLDHFKAVNDTHGHLVGDKVLRAVSDAIRQHLRTYDLAGRFGGEEFVVLLPNAGESDAISIAERLRRHVEAMRIPAGDDESGPCVTLTISVGVSALTSHTSELNDLMAAADAAMYLAKRSGRNRTQAARRPVGAVAAGSLGPEETPGGPADSLSAVPDASPV